MQRTVNIDTWIWMLLAVALVAIRLYPGFVPELGHDSFQYLSAADNALAGRIGYTSLIHYDVERAFGVLPAPMMTFPSGYPMAIAAVSLIGVSTQTAALLLSIVSIVGCIPLLIWIGARLGLPRALRNVVVACFVVNGIVSEYAMAALSEPLFMLLILIGVALLVKARTERGGQGVAYWLAAGLAIGATYFVRYAGLFFIVGLALVLVRHVLERNRVLARGHAIALGSAGLFLAAGFARNILLVGNWQGRGEMLVSNPLLAVIGQTANTINGLFLGVGTAKLAVGGTFIPKLVFVLSIAIGVGVLAWQRWRHRAAASEQALVGIRDVGIDLLVVIGTFIACMIYAGHTSSISYGAARHFLPLLPLMLLILGMGLHWLLPADGAAPSARRAAVVALSMSLVCYSYLNALVISKPRIDEEAVVLEQFASGGTEASASRTAVQQLVGPRGVILANNGQAVGYFLDRPTISTVNPTFSSITWDEQTVRKVVEQFHVAAVVITAPVPGQSDEETDLPSPFVQELAQGTAPPWLKLQHRSGSLLAYVPVGQPTVAHR